MNSFKVCLKGEKWINNEQKYKITNQKKIYQKHLQNEFNRLENVYQSKCFTKSKIFNLNIKDKIYNRKEIYDKK